MSIIIYLLQVSFCLGILVTCYWVFFRHSTFFFHNRIYLLLALMLAFVLPIVSFEVTSPFLSNKIGITDYSFDEGMIMAGGGKVDPGTPADLSLTVVLVVYLAGLAYMIFRMARSLRLIHVIRANSPVSLTHGYTVYRTQFPFSFTFIRAIYLPATETDPSVIAHEMAHVDANHWVDLFIVEAATALLWFNPFIHLVRKELKLLHEYAADDRVLRRGTSFEDYVQSLLSKAATGQHRIASAFNSSSTKKRIMMLACTKSSVFRYLGYMIIVPVVGLASVAFVNKPVAQSPTIPGTNVVTTPDTAPVDLTQVSSISVFGIRINPFTKKKQHHTGIDFALKEGSRVQSTADGTVVESYEDRYHGNQVVIRHDEVYTTRYTHLQSRAVKVGESVTKGQTIGYVGNTGLSAGPHLHYEILKDGKAVDPKGYLPKLPEL